MSQLSKWVMTAGVLLLIVGFLLNFIKLGRLPGDFIFKKGNTTFYFPMMTSIIVSIILSAIFYFLGRWK
ncbi:DUF2905 domain-containing protein [Falsibacillus albus]|uniref:DUF2905 domain-containing protein n=1 Tax=Falsibacillus albus TaxID=2478915 RepID=A0A3L7K651_9BACI|nr:DUF2905 domain-containing protein [Falsibacillus albus]RLQ98085.1 DUF2905 domain-containing protein [Falsibacillus albus]